ncbi:sensor histidine kinase [Micromonospora zhanjiangensis]
MLALLTVAVLAVTPSSFLLFAICPLAFRLLPMWPAAAVTTVANILPAAVMIGREGLTDHVRTHFVPMALGGALLSLGLGLWIRSVVGRSRERAHLIEQLEASRDEVARLSRDAGVAAERARLAGEIHDTLAQGFTSIVTTLQAADAELRPDQDGVRDRIGLAVRTARENLAESRALVAALAPPALRAGSLGSAVGDLVRRLGADTAIPAAYDLVGTPRRLPTNVEVVLVRAAQEALTNVRRHASAAAVSVTLEYRPDTVRLVVSDDGRGFDPASGAGGFGLRGIRTRADQVGGTVTVSSRTGSGTTVTVRVPA